MNISVANHGDIKYADIIINKISISSISIDPLKRIANFTVSYWNGPVLLEQESYTYKSTYTKSIIQQPRLKSISVSFITSYTITIDASINTPSGRRSYPNKQITSPYPYLTYLTNNNLSPLSPNNGNLTIYYNKNDPSIISIDSFLNSESLTHVSYAYGGNDKLSVFYTVNDVQYNVNINQPSTHLFCHAGITTLYTNSDYSDISLTTNSIYAIPFQIGGSNTLTVQSVPSTRLNVPNTQTNIYEGYDIRPFYKSVLALPTLKIYYNPDNISDISTTNTTPYIRTATGVTFTSATLITESLLLFTYQFSNLSYTANNSSTTNPTVIVTFQNKQLTTNSPLDSAQLFCNPLDTSDIGFQDDNSDVSNYNLLIDMLTTKASYLVNASLPKESLSKTDIVNLINKFTTINNRANISGDTIII
jgi:hypothetical protein